MRPSPKVGGELGIPYHIDRPRVGHGPESRRRKLQVAKDPVRAADMLTIDVVEGFGTRVTRDCCSSVRHVVGNDVYCHSGVNNYRLLIR